MTRTTGAIGVLSVMLAVSMINNLQLRGDNAELEERLSRPAPPPQIHETTHTVYAEDDRPDGPTQGMDKAPLEDEEALLAEVIAEDPTLVLTMPEVEEAMEDRLTEKLTERRRIWQRHRLDQARERLESYAEESELPEETVVEIDELMEETMVNIAVLRQERHAGTVPDEEAFKELSDLRDDFAGGLVEMLGEEEAVALQETFTGPLSRSYY